MARLQNLIPSRIGKKLRLILLVGTMLMEIYDVVVDSMEASDYEEAKSLFLSKPNPEVAVAFICLASIGAVFSLAKIVFTVIFYKQLNHNEKKENDSIQNLEVLRSKPESKEEIERQYEILNLVIKSLTLVFEDIAQAALPYWFVTRCSVDFDSVVKICFICVSPLLNFAYFSIIVIRAVWNYRGKYKKTLHVISLLLFLINMIPFVFGVLSSKVAFERTHLIGNVPKIVLIERERNTETDFGANNGTRTLEEKNLYAVWKIIERGHNHCANTSFKCQNESFFGHRIFNGCSEVRFILCYDSVLSNIVYTTQTCDRFPPNCHTVPLNSTGLSLKYTSDFCGKPEADPDRVSSIRKCN